MAYQRRQVQNTEIRDTLSSDYADRGLHGYGGAFNPADFKTEGTVGVRENRAQPQVEEYQLNQLLKTHIDEKAGNVPISNFSLQHFDKEISQNLLKLKTANDPLGQMAKKISDLISFRNNFIETLEGTSKRYQQIYMMTKAEADQHAMKYLGPAMQEEIKMINSLYPGLGTDKELTVENVGKLVNLNYMQ